MSPHTTTTVEKRSHRDQETSQPRSPPVIATERSSGNPRVRAALTRCKKEGSARCGARGSDKQYASTGAVQTYVPLVLSVRVRARPCSAPPANSVRIQPVALRQVFLVPVELPFAISINSRTSPGIAVPGGVTGGVTPTGSRDGVERLVRAFRASRFRHPRPR